jgi:Fe-S-cluster containining protein
MTSESRSNLSLPGSLTRDSRGDVFYAKGLRFSCTRCGGCCSGFSGYVYLSESDIDSIAGHIGIDKAVFVRRYTRTVRVYGETRLSLIEKTPFDCVFYREGCLIYGSRPYQCRSYPFWKRNVVSLREWDAASRNCPGMDRGELHTAREIERWLAHVPVYDVTRFDVLPFESGADEF